MHIYHTKFTGRLSRPCDSETDFRSGADRFFVFNREIRSNIHAKHFGSQIIGELAHRGVVGLYRFYVAIARHSNAVFRAFQLLLQFQEISIGFQFWVFLYHHHQF